MISTASHDAARQQVRLPLRWILAGLLVLASVLNYIDRQALSILAPTIQKELGISDSGYATVVQCFLFFYTIMYLLSGRLVDRLGTRLAESLFILWWSVANLLTGFVSGVVSLGFVRSLLGIGEPGNFTAAAKAVSEWFPAREKGIAVGMYSMGGTLGAAIAAPLVAFITLRYGWRSAFIFTGLLGIALTVLWAWLYRKPSEHPLLSASEREFLQREGVLAAKESQPRAAGWKRVFSSRPMWVVLLSRMITDPLWFFYLFWFPKYLQDVRGFTLADVGKTLWIVFVSADIGCLLGGWLSGYWIRHGVTPVAARLRVMGGAAVLLAFSCAMPLLPGLAYPLLAASLFALAHMAWMTNSTTLPIDLFATSEIGSIQGAVGAGSSLGGFLSAGIIGWVITHYSYSPLFVAMSFLHPAAFWFLFRNLPRTREKE